MHDWTPLHYSASDGHLEVCRLLLDFRGDVEAQVPDGSTPLMFAVEEAHVAVARLLLERGARTSTKDEAGFTALNRCATAVREEVLHELESAW